MFDLKFSEETLLIKKIEVNKDNRGSKMNFLKIHDAFVQNINLNNCELNSLCIGHDQFIFDDLYEQDNIKNKDILEGYQNCKNITFDFIDVLNFNKNISLFKNEQNFNNLTDLKLLDIKHIHFMTGNLTKKNCNNLINLTIVRCNLKNFILDFLNVKELKIIESEIDNDNSFHVNMKKNNKLLINLKNNEFNNFNILTKSNLKNTSIKINQNTANEVKQSDNHGSTTYFNLLNETFRRELIRNRERKKNEIIINLN